MSKSTPGPWVIYDDINENHIAIKGFFPKTGGAHVAEVLGSANAHLIAAAPDLLAAAKEALAFLTANGMSHGKSLAAAIAKAEP